MAIASVALSGCVPYATPPAVLAVGPAWHSGRTTKVDEDGSVGAVQLEASVRPLSAFASLERRRVDLGARYLGELTWSESAASLHHLQLQVEAYPWLRRGGRRLWRVGPYLSAGAVFTSGLDDEQAGLSVDGGAMVEWGSFSRGTTSLPGKYEKTLGYAYGAFGVGLQLGAGLRRIHGECTWTMSLALRVRLPLSVGIACCRDPSD